MDTKNKIDNFLRKLPSDYQDGALLMVYYATFPIIISPELLYLLWLNFPEYTKYEEDTCTIPITVISDLLQSSLCEEVGSNNFEIKAEVCSYLKKNIKSILLEREISIHYTNRELYLFILEYANKFCQSPLLKNLYNFYYWNVNLILFPEKANKRIKELLGADSPQELSKLNSEQSQITLTLAEKQAQNQINPNTENKDISKRIPTLSAQKQENSKAITDPEIISIVENIIPDLFQNESNTISISGTIEELQEETDTPIDLVPIEKLGVDKRKAAYSTNEKGEIIGITLRWQKIKNPNFLIKFPKLQYLYLGANQIQDLFIFNKLPELKVLGLNSNIINNPLDGKILSNLKQLEYLYLKDNKIVEIYPEFLENLPALKELYLEGNPNILFTAIQDKITANKLTLIKDYESISLVTPQTTTITKPKELVILHSYKDERYLDEATHWFQRFANQGKVKIWTEHDIDAGDIAYEQKVKKVNTADIIVLLISANFLALDDTWDILSLSKATAVVVSVILSPCDWNNNPIHKLQALPKDAKPISIWENRDEAWLDVVRGIRELLEPSLLEQIKQVRKLIAENKLKDAVDLLEYISPKYLKNDIIQLQARLQILEGEVMFHIVTVEDEQKEQVKITKAILNLCEIIENSERKNYVWQKEHTIVTPKILIACTDSFKIQQQLHATHEVESLKKLLQDRFYSTEIIYGANLAKIEDAFQQDVKHQIRVIHIAGYISGKDLASYIGNINTVKMVVINGSSTSKEVHYFIDSGVPIVISTLRPIQERIAQAFTAYFYESLLAGKTLLRAFTETESRIDAQYGLQNRQFSRNLFEDEEEINTLFQLHPSPNSGSEILNAKWTQILHDSLPQKEKKVFISYSQKDTEYLEDLEMHLAILKRQQLIDTWHKGDVTLGEDIAAKVDKEIKTANIILLLVSEYYLADTEIWDNEIMIAVERHKRMDAILVPIILTPCDWQDTPFAGLVTLPKNSTISQMDREETFMQIALELKKSFLSLKKAESNLLYLKSQISEVKLLIGKVQLKDALFLLYEITHDEHLRNDVLLLNSRFSKLQKDSKLGLVNPIDVEIERNKIVNAALMLCEDIKENYSKETEQENKNIIQIANDTQTIISAIEHQLQIELTEVPFSEFLGESENNYYSINEQGQITSLNLSKNNLTDISFLSNLVDVEILDIRDNNITDISPVSNMLKLRQLVLDKNLILDISPLANLTNLTTLFFDNNKVSDISPLQNLTQLTTLWFNHNFVTDISPLSNLHQLKELRFLDNKVEDLLPIKFLIEKEVGFNYLKNPLINPPIEVAQQGNNAILSYWNEIKDIEDRSLFIIYDIETKDIIANVLNSLIKENIKSIIGLNQENNIINNKFVLAILSEKKINLTSTTVKGIQFFHEQKFTDKKLIIAFTEGTFFEKTFFKDLIDGIEHNKKELKSEIRKYLLQGYHAFDLKEDLKNYIEMQNSLPKMIETIKNYPCIDLSKNNFEEGMKKILNIIKSEHLKVELFALLEQKQQNTIANILLKIINSGYDYDKVIYTGINNEMSNIGMNIYAQTLVKKTQMLINSLK